MKKLLVVAMMLALSTGAFASNLYLGGMVGYTHAKAYEDGLSADQTRKEFNLIPLIGYDINENWDLGMAIKFGYTELTTSADKGHIQREAGVNPFVRYKVASIGSLDVLAQAGVNFELGNITCDNSDHRAITREYGINIAPVLKYNVSDSLKVVCLIDFLKLGYEHSESQLKNGNQVKADAFGFKANNGQFLTLGMEYHF